MQINVPAGARLLLDLLRSDQLTPSEVQHVLEDNPVFALWYRLHADKI